MTHKQVKNTDRRWQRNYGSEAPRLVKARRITDASLQGIHLLNPTKDELSEAFCAAQRDLFPRIWVHTKRTFGKVA